MVGFWPSDLIAHRGAGTTFHLESIEAAIRLTAAAAGIAHQHWHNIDSSIMGPSLRVIMVAKLTVAVARFTRWQSGPVSHWALIGWDHNDTDTNSPMP